MLTSDDLINWPDHKTSPDHRGDLVVKVNVNGSICVVEQCSRCGRVVRSVKRYSKHLPEKQFDTALKAEADKQLSAYFEMMRKGRMNEVAAEQSAWRRRYDEYMASDRWKAKRDAVLADAGGRCEARLPGCLGAADSVHHTSYRRMGNEASWELMAVCDRCHAAIHGVEEDPIGEAAAAAILSKGVRRG
jgi:5-methylcytosine-specific restriction endonuclease McrA